MPLAAKLHTRLRDQAVPEEEVLMVSLRNPSRSGDKSLYVTSGAMFAGWVGVFLFAAPGGVIGAAVGAFAGLLYAQQRLAGSR
jgi:uncharacterized membrane protein